MKINKLKYKSNVDNTLKKNNKKPLQKGQLVRIDGSKPITFEKEYISHASPAAAKPWFVVADDGSRTYNIKDIGQSFNYSTIESGIGRSSSSKSVIVVGDMHVGHYYALGSPLKKLRKINEFWSSARDQLMKERANIFVINGEPIDGDNPRQLSGEQWTNDMAEQMEYANDLISEYKMDTIGLTRGSNYHSTRGNTNFESILTKYLTVAPILDYSPYGKHFKHNRGSEHVTERHPVSHHPYRRIEDILQISVNGLVFNIIHHTGVSSSFTHAPTSIATQILKNLIVTGRIWKKTPTFTVRSHTHQFVLVEYGNTVGWVNPSWQIFSMYTLQKSMSAGSIGLVEVIIESNGKYIINKIILPDKDYPKIAIAEIK